MASWRSALLHDVLEDTRTGYDELAAAFGERVARIVQDNSDDMTLPKPERRRARLAGISKKSREARLVKFADIISNLRAIAVSPPAGWSNDRRLGYLDSYRNLVDAGRGSNAEIERIFDDTAKAVEQAIRSEGGGPSPLTWAGRFHREEPVVQRKAAAFARWHEPDDARDPVLNPPCSSPLCPPIGHADEWTPADIYHTAP